MNEPPTLERDSRGFGRNPKLWTQIPAFGLPPGERVPLWGNRYLRERHSRGCAGTARAGMAARAQGWGAAPDREDRVYRGRRAAASGAPPAMTRSISNGGEIYGRAGAETAASLARRHLRTAAGCYTIAWVIANWG
jgi:hypothetical protein